MLKLAKNQSSALVIPLISKLPAGKELRDQPRLKEEKKFFPIFLILLVLKLPVGSEVRVQL